VLSDRASRLLNLEYQRKAGRFPENRIQESGVRIQEGADFWLLDSDSCPTKISRLKLISLNLVGVNPQFPQSSRQPLSSLTGLVSLLSQFYGRQERVAIGPVDGQGILTEFKANP